MNQPTPPEGVPVFEDITGWHVAKWWPRLNTWLSASVTEDYLTALARLDRCRRNNPDTKYVLVREDRTYTLMDN